MPINLHLTVCCCLAFIVVFMAVLVALRRIALQSAWQNLALGDAATFDHCQSTALLQQGMRHCGTRGKSGTNDV